MNLKMTNEMKVNIEKSKLVILKDLASPSHNIENSLHQFKDKPYQLRKSIDYLNLFSEVNRELIDTDSFKKRRGKVTARYPISPEFIEATECMERITKFIREIKIISISETRPSHSVANRD